MKKMLGLAAAAAVALPILAPAAAMADDSGTQSEPPLSADMQGWSAGLGNVGLGAGEASMAAVHGLPIYVLGLGWLPPQVATTLGWNYTNEPEAYGVHVATENDEH
ncbi:hypothetical protein [Actinospica sp.]|jgi:hypothetical protein|uniref:hypothetical protein n=1 Tax=Actinospica sp. TaxID=1872142 RepID=UPI002C257245|nr:hypothetical protein [Actinospica sp.]HWG25969.1 hypothetical protein [Actinospica sp.]